MIADRASSRLPRVALARLRQTLGWSGTAGLLLLAGASVLAASAWSDRRAVLETTARVNVARLASRAAPASAPLARGEDVPSLPTMGDVPTLLNRIETIAVANRLGWNAADYRLRPAADHEPAAMEIRTQFSGAYPQVRRTVMEIAGKVPGVAIRQFDLSRASTDSPDVTAKVVFAILLADDVAPPARAGVSR